LTCTSPVSMPFGTGWLLSMSITQQAR
jgi:hypothetical protein